MSKKILAMFVVFTMSLMFVLPIGTVFASETPVITVSSGSTVFEKNGTYVLKPGDRINISASGDIQYIKYKIGTEDTITVNNSNIQLTVSEKFKEFSLQVFARSNSGQVSGSQYDYYNIVVPEKPTITVKSGSNIFSPNGTYTVKIGDKINISASPDIQYIKYKVGTGELITVNNSNIQLTVSEKFKEFSLQVFARTIHGMSSGNEYEQYNFIVEDEKPIEPTKLTIKSGDTIFNPNGTYTLTVGDKININASPNVQYIKYKVGTGEVVTVNSSNVELTVPEEFVSYTLQVFVRGDNGNIDWQLYNIEVKTLDNTNYPVIMQSDEKNNDKLNELAISLRTIPLIEKAGNQNFFALNENIQYNIDFVNAGEEINGKVYIYFKIPTNVEATFVDTKGGELIDSKTLKWEFNGLKHDEKGTIPVRLKYTNISGNANEVKPSAEIESSYKKDSSSVINYIYLNSSIVVNTNHEPFMIGDAGTNTFRPNEGINRAEVAMILTRIFDIKLINNYTVTYKDADVIAQNNFKWAEQAIMTVTRYGLMEGYDDGEFKPGEKVTKAQLITILARQIAIENENTNGFIIKEQPIKVFNNLSDVYTNYGYTSHWATKYIAQMMRLNMLPELKNTVDGNLDMMITRAETAKLISTMLLRGPSIDGTSNRELTNTFVDVNGATQHYQFILEASADMHNSKFSGNGVETMVK